MASSESIEAIDNAVEKENMRKVEAALFVSGKFMSMPELVALTDVNPILLRRILEELDDKYKDCGIELVNKNSLWKMDVSADYLWMVNRLAGGSSEFSKAEKETLAIIAYKQPIKQSVIIKIRGNKAYDHIKKYNELALINKKKMGHTYELSLNDSFHDYFSLRDDAGGSALVIKAKEEKIEGNAAGAAETNVDEKKEIVTEGV